MLKITSTLIFCLITVIGCSKNSMDSNMDRKPIFIGDFIQPGLVANWSEDEWDKHLRELKEVGIEYVIFAPALYEDKTGQLTSLYPSSIKGVKFNYKFDLIERCLKVAEKNQIKIFIGLNFSEDYWTHYFSKEWFMPRMKQGEGVAKELYQRYKHKFPNAFHGWYWIWEVDNYHSQPISSQTSLIEGLQLTVEYVDKIDNKMPLMLSPFMNSSLGTATAYAAIWGKVFQSVKFRSHDIFVPQDCIGAGGLKLGESKIWFEQLALAVKENSKIQLWGNIENFEQKFWTSATLDRVKQQINDIRPFVSNFISFSYSHYYTSAVHKDKFHKSYKYFINHGELPSKSKLLPIDITQITTKSNNNYTITFKPKNPVEEIVGYRLYENNTIIIDKQISNNSMILDLSTTKSLKDMYIVVYNEIGQESSKVAIEKPI